MKIKEGASLQGLQPEMRPALLAADRIWKALGQELVVTSGTDGAHSAGSLHYYGWALDFRTHYFDEESKHKAADALKVALANLEMRLANGEYRVVVEKTHIHVQFKPPKVKGIQQMITTIVDGLEF